MSSLEGVLLADPAVRECLALRRQTASGDSRSILYLVTSERCAEPERDRA